MTAIRSITESIVGPVSGGAKPEKRNQEKKEKRRDQKGIRMRKLERGKGSVDLENVDD